MSELVFVLTEDLGLTGGALGYFRTLEAAQAHAQDRHLSHQKRRPQVGDLSWASATDGTSARAAGYNRQYVITSYPLQG